MQNEPDPNLPHVRSFMVGQQVLVENYRGGKKWLNGDIREALSPVTSLVKRHVNQMLSTKRKQTRLSQRRDSSAVGCWDFDELSADNELEQ